MFMLTKFITDPSINLVDSSAAGTGVLVWLKFFPDLAGLATVIWLGLRIYITLRDEIFKRKGKKDGDLE